MFEQSLDRDALNSASFDNSCKNTSNSVDAYFQYIFTFQSMYFFSR